MNSFSRDAGIPLLTEIIFAPIEADLPLAAAPFPAAPAASSMPLAELADAAAAPDSSLSRDEFNRLADIVLTKVLEQLQHRFDTLLGPRLEMRLSAKLDGVAAILADEIRHEVRQELTDLVTVTRASNDSSSYFKKE